MCTEAILWDPDFSKYHLLHNELQTAQLLWGHKQYMQAENH
jgi:hypothetical protein